jgi:hypothetical protein
LFGVARPRIVGRDQGVGVGPASGRCRWTDEAAEFLAIEKTDRLTALVRNLLDMSACRPACSGRSSVRAFDEVVPAALAGLSDGGDRRRQLPETFAGAAVCLARTVVANLLRTP